MSTGEIERLPGTCPTCDGEAIIFRSPADDDSGHAYCQEDDCGWIHRHLSAVSRFVDGESDV